MSDHTPYVYGIHAVEEALNAGTVINKLIVAKDSRNEILGDLVRKANKLGVPVQFVPREAQVFPKLKNHQGILAYLSPVVYHSLENLIPSLFESGKVPFLLVLDSITDVRNFGAIARSAYCGGVDAIIIPDSGSAPVNEDAIKTSAGALMNIPVCRENNFKTVMELLNQSGITTIACTEKANKEIPFVDLTEPIAIVFGSEEKGIRKEVLGRCSISAKIPMELGVGSLNVSVAAGIAVYETVRQRMQKGNIKSKE